MSKITSDEQVIFLISCINHSNNGKVDFAEVAKECNIVTAGAAAKRYSRLLKSVEASTGGASPGKKKTGDNDASAASPEKKGAGAKRKAPSAKKAPSKKAKAMKEAAVALAEDLVEKKFPAVKEEEEDSELSDGAVSNEDDEDVKKEIKEEDEE